MSIFAVGVITDFQSILGLRLLDTNSGQVKDVSYGNIEKALNDRIICISNVRLVRGKLQGHNCQLDDLPTIINGDVYLTSPIIILNKLEGFGYTVTDVTGEMRRLSEMQTIREADARGLVNGTVFNTDEGEIQIRPISGHYPIIVDNTNNSIQDNNGMYIGELVQELGKLKPVIVSHYGYDKYKIINYQGNKLVTYTDDNFILSVSRDMINKDVSYHDDRYSFIGKVYRSLNINKPVFEREIEQLIRIKNFRDAIDNSVVKATSKRVAKAPSLRNCKNPKKVDLSTGILLPTTSVPYSSIEVHEHIQTGHNKYDNIPIEEIEKYKRMLKVMNCAIYSETDFGEEGLILFRKCSKRGIFYKRVVLDRWGTVTNEVKLEDIFSEHYKYQNVKVDGDIMTIVGLDGAYSYDMEKIYEQYNTRPLKTTRSMKALLVDSLYSEKINEKGELSNLSSGKAVVMVPNDVKIILRGAIQLNENNKEIRFGENLEKVSTLAIKADRENISDIHISCGKSAGVQILKALKKVFYWNHKLNINYTRDIHPEEYIEVCEWSNTTINSGILSNMTDEFIVTTIKLAIKMWVDNFNILKKPIEYKTYYTDNHRHKISFLSYHDYTSFKIAYKRLRYLWENKLRHKASSSVVDGINKLFINVDDKIKFREKEFTADTGQVIS